MKHLVSMLLFNITIGSYVISRKEYRTLKSEKSGYLDGKTPVPLEKYKYKNSIHKVVAIRVKYLFFITYVVEKATGGFLEISPVDCREINFEF